MSLIKCNECGKEISNKADLCPFCGYKIKGNSAITVSNQIRTGTIVSIIANILIILMIACLFVSSILPENSQTSDSSGGVHVTISSTPEQIELIYGIFILISIILAIFCFIWCILYLCNKIKNINAYKIVLLISSIIELVMSVLSINGFVCCGMVYAIFPLINLIGAIIVTTGRSK